MALPRTVSDVVAEHVTFEVECIDRVYLNCYVPKLQYPAGLVGDVHQQLGLPIASTSPLAERMWQLRQQHTGYDASYLALAEALSAPLYTCDTTLDSGSHAAPLRVIPQTRSPAACRSSNRGSSRS